MKKKIVSLLMVSLMTIGLFAGCGDTDKEVENSKGNNAETDDVYENGLSKTEEVTITFAYQGLGNGTAREEAAVALFEEMYPNVHVEVTESINMGTIIENKIAAGDEDMYDVFGSVNFAPLAAANKVEYLDDMWEWELLDTPGVKLKDVCQDAMVNYSFIGGWPDGEKHVAYFPVSHGGYCGFFYNKALFEENGWNQSPQTYQEFLDLCEDIKVDGMTPLIFTGVSSYYLDISVSPNKIYELAAEDGAFDEAYDRQMNFGDEYYTNKYTTEMYSRFAEQGKLGYWHEGMAGMNHTQAQMQIILGNVAMVSSGSWIGNEMADSVEDGFEWGYMSMPMRSTTETPIYVNASAGPGYGVWADSPEIEKAWAKEFLRVFWNMDIQEAGAQSGIISIRDDYADDPERLQYYDSAIKSAMAYCAENKCVQVLDVHDTVLPGAAIYAQACQLMYDSNVDMVLGNVDVEEVLAEANDLLEKAKVGD